MRRAEGVGGLVLVVVIALAGAWVTGEVGGSSIGSEWPGYGGGPENTHYSALNQIDRSNVARLEVAWTYDTGDVFEGSEMQCNPVVADGLLFGTSPKMRVFALDPATGQERWSFNPVGWPGGGVRSAGRPRNRGVTYWAGDGPGLGRVYVAWR
ncbi:MAG: hypothetical protein EBU88_18500, partial [Acidobacteria bacterium]|nr:hypothetical protein [Acidobacteriota bacterium]